MSTPIGPITQERYDQVKPAPENGGFFQHFPGVYCQKCGADYALYSYSFAQPAGLDENRKPFYKECHRCPKA